MELSKLLINKRFWLDLIMPNRCCFCKKIIKWNLYCCDECAKTIPYIDEPICKLCGKDTCICSRGLSYNYCFSVVWYDSIVRNSIVKFKSESPENFCLLFGKNLAEQISESSCCSEIDLITCIPMTNKSKRERGYNQAFELARVIGKSINKNVSDKILIKKRDSISQHKLQYEQRLTNIKNLFNISSKCNIKGKTILLIDDVITTGSTLDACSKVLKQNGAKVVICAVVANTKLINK